MSDLLQINTHMPYMPFNWLVHNARVCRLSFIERGLLDAVRTELWTVVGCKMPRTTLLARLRIEEGSPESKMLDQLVALDLLTRDQDEMVYDRLQVQEFAKAVHKAAVNKANGSKGGRKRNSGPPSVSQPEDGQPEDGGDF